jgi:acetolactate synthase-1/2/3 large subunit
VLTPKAKGLISEDHECYAGVLFHSLSDYLWELYEKTDLVIGLGYDPVEFNYESWKNIAPYRTILYQNDLFGSDAFPGTKVLHADSYESMRKALIKALSVN